jgi:hypothetical protein
MLDLVADIFCSKTNTHLYSLTLRYRTCTPLMVKYGISYLTVTGGFFCAGP